MTELGTDSVVSGVPYAVTRADGRPVATATEFVGETAFLVHQSVQHSSISGFGVAEPGGAVRFYQKDPDHDGRDVRVWLLRTVPGGGVTAEHAAAI